jgi:hypothetical protein
MKCEEIWTRGEMNNNNNTQKLTIAVCFYIIMAGTGRALHREASGG